MIRFVCHSCVRGFTSGWNKPVSVVWCLEYPSFSARGNDNVGFTRVLVSWYLLPLFVVEALCGGMSIERYWFWF